MRLIKAAGDGIRTPEGPCRYDSKQDMRPGKTASLTLARPRWEESGASAAALALAAVRA